jgi:hypothetical protein
MVVAWLIQTLKPLSIGGGINSLIRVEYTNVR